MKKQLLSFMLTLSLIGSSSATEHSVLTTQEVLKEAFATAEKVYSKRGVKKVILNNIPAALAGVAASILGNMGATAARDLTHGFLHKNGSCTTHHSPEHVRHTKILSRVFMACHTISFALTFLATKAAQEAWKQYRESKKSRMIIEHLVKHFSEHQDELNDDQNIVFASLITEFNAKKSLSIKNPHEMLAEIQAVLSAAAQ